MGSLRTRSLVLAAALWLASSAAGVWAQVYVYVDDSGSIHFSDVQRHAGFRPFRARSRPGVDLRRVAANANLWDSWIRRAAKHHEVAPALIKAIIRAESNFDPRAVSKKGAQGLMQLMPGTARALGVDDPFDPWQNIEGGTRYIRYLLARFPTDTGLALAAYNAGEQNVRRYEGIPPFPETRKYVKRVLHFYRGYDATLR